MRFFFKHTDTPSKNIIPTEREKQQIREYEQRRNNMKVYLGGPYQWKERIEKARAEMESAGITCTSTWLNETHNPSTQLADLSEELHTRYALRDIEDISRAGYFVLFAVPPTDDPIPRAGRHVEFGYALALDLTIYVVGTTRENIFHYLPDIKHFETWDDVLAQLIKKSTEALGR